MKTSFITVFFTCLLFSASSFAGGNMDMEKMMQQAEAAQACFEKIDESKLMVLEQEGRKMEQEINALCKAGKKSEANSKALQYSLKIQKDPNFQQIQACATHLEGMPIPKPYMPITEDEVGQANSVCD